MKFKKNLHAENEILDGDNFFISYNSGLHQVIPSFISDDGGAETALVNLDDPYNKYRILNGDFREEYEKLVPLGFQACLEFYNTMIKKGFNSSWSD